MNCKRGVVGLLLALWLPVQAWAHQFHTSITDAKYNPKTKSYELAIRVFADDLENALSRRNKATIRLDRSEKVNKLMAEYVQSHLTIVGVKGTRPVQKFVGVQEEADAVWIYVEIPAAKSPVGSVWVLNSLLTELFDDQTNILNLEVAGKKHSVLTRPDDTQQSVSI